MNFLIYFPKGKTNYDARLTSALLIFGIKINSDVWAPCVIDTAHGGLVPPSQGKAGAVDWPRGRATSALGLRWRRRGAKVAATWLCHVSTGPAAARARARRRTAASWPPARVPGERGGRGEYDALTLVTRGGRRRPVAR